MKTSGLFYVKKSNHNLKPVHDKSHPSPISKKFSKLDFWQYEIIYKKYVFKEFFWFS